MTKELIDVDLDVKLATDDFPQNEYDGYVYLRANLRDKTCTHISMGSFRAIGQAILSAMDEDDEFATLVTEVTVQYLERLGKDGKKNDKLNNIP